MCISSGVWSGRVVVMEVTDEVTGGGGKGGAGEPAHLAGMPAVLMS